MEIRKQSKDGPSPSLAEVGGLLNERVEQEKQRWLSELSEHPEQFRQIEQEVHRKFGQLADEVVAALLAEAAQSQALAARKKSSWIRRLIRCVGRRSGP